MRRPDIEELFKEVNEYLDLIKKQYKDAISDRNKKEILKPKVKSSLEHLRSCLDYLAHDLYDFIYKPNDGLTKVERENKVYKKLYFPYGIDSQVFRRSVGKVLCNLYRKNRYVYELLESVQPYKSSSKWLVNLCLENNHIKHNNLRAQKRIDRNYFYILGGAIEVILNKGNEIGEPTEFNLKNNIYTGKGPFITIENKNDVILNIENENVNGRIYNGRYYISDLADDIIIQDEHYLINWVDFVFEGTDISILRLIETSLKEVQNLTIKFYKHFPRYEI